MWSHNLNLLLDHITTDKYKTPTDFMFLEWLPKKHQYNNFTATIIDHCSHLALIISSISNYNSNLS